MSEDKYGPNTVEVNGTPMLLTTTGGGVAVHLTGPAEPPGSGREAVPGDAFTGHPDRLAGYDRAALTERRWSDTTLCGRAWAEMIGGDGGAVNAYEEVAYAPTCRRCLSIMDTYFPKPEPDPRLELVAQVAADTVVDGRGFAEVHGVPGDQQAELRKTIRRLIRRRVPHSVETIVIHSVIHVICPAIYDQQPDETRREANEAIGTAHAADSPPAKDRDWVISWSAWGVS